MRRHRIFFLLLLFETMVPRMYPWRLINRIERDAFPSRLRALRLRLTIKKIKIRNSIRPWNEARVNESKETSSVGFLSSSVVSFPVFFSWRVRGSVIVSGGGTIGALLHLIRTGGGEGGRVNKSRRVTFSACNRAGAQLVVLIKDYLPILCRVNSNPSRKLAHNCARTKGEWR